MVGLLWASESYSKLCRPIHKGTTHGRPEKLVTDPVKSNETDASFSQHTLQRQLLLLSPQQELDSEGYIQPPSLAFIWSQQSNNFIQIILIKKIQLNTNNLITVRISSCLI